MWMPGSFSQPHNSVVNNFYSYHIFDPNIDLKAHMLIACSHHQKELHCIQLYIELNNNTVNSELPLVVDAGSQHVILLIYLYAGHFGAFYHKKNKISIHYEDLIIEF